MLYTRLNVRIAITIEKPHDREVRLYSMNSRISTKDFNIRFRKAREIRLDERRVSVSSANVVECDMQMRRIS